MVNGQTQIEFPGGGHANVYETQAPVFKDGVVEMDITSAKAGTRIGILFRAQDMNNRVYVGVGDSANQYFTEYWGTKEGNTWSSMYVGDTFEANKTMHLKAEIVDKTITLWVNGELVLQNTMPEMPAAAGYFGINTRTNHTITVDNVKVTSYDLPTGDLQNVAGRVVGEGNAAIEGLAVELLDNNGEVVKTTTTDALGNYKFKNVVVGEYQVRVAYGEIKKVIPVTVEKGEDYVVVEKAVMFVDKSDLQALITYANAQKEEESYQYVIPAVKTLFEAKLAEAVAVNENGAATQEEVDAAYEALLAKVQLLGYVGNSEELRVLVDVVEGMRLDKIYTEESVADVREALDAAKEVLANENAIQEEIDNAKAALQAAVDALDRIPVDKSKLEKLVASSAKYEEKIDQYTPITAEAFTAALAGARDVLADEYAIQEEVDAAYATLQNAIFALREVPNKDKLAELIKEAEGLDLTKYTAQSAFALRTALADARTVMDDPNATEAEVKACLLYTSPSPRD